MRLKIDIYKHRIIINIEDSKMEVEPMNSAIDVAKFIVRNSKKDDMTNLRIQKILYYLYVLFYRRYSKELFYEEFYAYNYGPVVKNVYEFYKIFGNRTVPIFEVDKNLFLNNEEKNFLIEMTHRLEEYSVYDLVESTHMYEPWIKTPLYGIMNKKKIKEYHKVAGITMYRYKNER